MAWAKNAGRPVVAAAVNAARRAAALDEIGGRAWFALRVAPQAEFLTVALLARRGLWGWTPTRTVWRKANRMARRKTARTYSDLPGYVLIGFACDGDPWAQDPGAWNAALSVRPVLGVMGVAGRPARLGAQAVEWAAMRSSVAPDAHRHMRTGGEFAAGDRVRVVDGAARGVAGVVLAIEGQSARMLAPFLGAERELTAPLCDLALAG